MTKKRVTRLPKVCELCNEDLAIAGEKYCKPCRKIKLDDMKNQGYLTTGGLGHAGGMRTIDMKEDCRSTKYGRDG